VKSALVRSLKRLNVKQQLILLFGIMAIPLVILYSYGNMKAEQILKRHVTNAYVELNKQNVTIINRDIDSVKEITSTVIQNSLIQQFDINGNKSVFQRVKDYEKIENMLIGYSQARGEREPIYYSLYIYDPSNNYFFAPNYPENKKSGVYFFSDQKKPSWFDEAIKKKGNGYLHIIDKLSPQANSNRTLSYVRAINNIYKGGTIGVLVVTKMDSRIGESLKAVNLPEGEIYFTNWNNEILSSTTPSAGEILTLPAEANKLTSSEGVRDIITSDFIYVINYNHILEQKLIYRIPVKALLQQQNEMKHVIQITSVVYSFLAVMMIMYFWRNLMRPLQSLAFFVRKYEPGRSVPATPRRDAQDEVSVLIASTYDMARRLNDLIYYNYQMEIKQKESQLQILYHQINPHLLYNTLESIYWKSMLEGSQESAEMIKELSKLMKISLSRGRELITIEEELEHATAYINLQKHRYEYNFSVDWNISNEILGFYIPKVTLQPLIENAINHGVKNMGDDGHITISAISDNGYIQIKIEDNGFKKVDFKAIDRLINDKNPNPSIGYGIRNIQQRIQLHFGYSYGISYASRESSGTVVTITIPKFKSEG